MQKIFVILLIVCSAFYLGYRMYKSFKNKKCGDKSCGGCG